MLSTTDFIHRSQNWSTCPAHLTVWVLSPAWLWSSTGGAFFVWFSSLGLYAPPWEYSMSLFPKILTALVKITVTFIKMTSQSPSRWFSCLWYLRSFDFPHIEPNMSPLCSHPSCGSNFTEVRIKWERILPWDRDCNTWLFLCSNLSPPGPLHPPHPPHQGPHTYFVLPGMHSPETVLPAFPSLLSSLLAFWAPGFNVLSLYNRLSNSFPGTIKPCFISFQFWGFTVVLLPSLCSI